jgi:hypothetical protein
MKYVIDGNIDWKKVNMRLNIFYVKYLVTIVLYYIIIIIIIIIGCFLEISQLHQIMYLVISLS